MKLHTCPNNGKVQHETEEDAEVVLDKMLKEKPDYDGRPYFCVYCEKWHLGRKKKRK